MGKTYQTDRQTKGNIRSSLPDLKRPFIDPELNIEVEPH